MDEIVQGSEGFDLVIIVTSNDKQAAFWKERLEAVKDQIIGKDARIYCVVEEWEAGQLLGTLNAWEKVSAYEDLESLLRQGGKIAIYHTAGHGKRMAPLVQSEGNDKAGIKLPGLLNLSGRKVPMRLLEAVIYQSSIFAPSRKGRICVFWADQIFIPSGDVEFEGKHHVELFTIRKPAPDTREEWEREWQAYGLVIPREDGCMMLEKQSWDEFERLVEDGVIKQEDGRIIIGKGLGCFSISYEFFIEVLSEFKKDLEERRKLDTDPDLWMPLTSPDRVEPEKRARVEPLIRRFDSKGAIFGDKDMGAGTYWWDLGQPILYHEHLLKLTQDTEEGEVMRAFFRADSSGIIGSEVEGMLRGCVVVDSRVEDSDLNECVVISSMIRGVSGNKSLIYNCIELSGFDLGDENVVADVFHPMKGKIRMKRGILRDGKKDWDMRLLPNPYSYRELEHLMRDVPIDDTLRERETWERYWRLNLGDKFEQLSHSVIRLKENTLKKPWGSESWICSGHPKNPSMIKVGEIDVSLIHLLNHRGEEIIGDQLYRDFRGEFPVILKFIYARENLSVQVHPSDDDAARLGEPEPGKTEGWYVIDAEPGAKIYLSLRRQIADLSEICEDVLHGVEIKKGDVFLVPPGTLHAIGAGTHLFEIQESSDLTYRVWDWGRQRETHLDKACLVSITDQDAESLKQTPREIDGEAVLLDTVYFTLSLASSGLQETKGSFHTLTCIEGEAEIEYNGGRERLSTGETVLIPASITSYMLRSNGKILKSYLRTPSHIDPVIFQTYDVRAPETMLPDRICYYLGKGYGTYLRRERGEESEHWVCVGGGIRLSTERIRRALIDGIRSSGVNVYDIGITSTPELYFAIPFLHADGGINITASHNEAIYNGLKQVIRSDDEFIMSINADQMLEIKRIILGSDFLYGKGERVKVKDGLIPRYHNLLVESNCRLGREIWIHLLREWDLKELLDTLAEIEFPGKADGKRWQEIKERLRIPDEIEMPETAVAAPLDGLKVVIDFGNGSTWRTKSVYLNLGCEVVGLNETPDGRFPAHHPDPIKAKYRRQLEELTVKVAESEKEKEVVGFGHDEDGDRVIFVRSDGRVVEGDRTLAIQAKDIIEEYRKKGKVPRFMGEVKFSRVTEEFITSHGGIYIMSPTGFAFIKERMKEIYLASKEKGEEGVVLAAELSGHQMSGQEENWMFDDGTLAAVKILSVIAKAKRRGRTFIDLDEEVPRYPATPEINIRLPTNRLDEKEEVVRKALEIFEAMGFEIDRTDGGIIRWYDDKGWVGQALIRKSNTQPMVICRVEGRDEAAKARVEEEFFGVLKKVSTERIPRLDLGSDDYVREWMSRGT